MKTITKKTKTQITLNNHLELIVQMVRLEYPTFDINESIELLIAKGVKAYLDQIGLTLEDLEDIKISQEQIKEGQSTKAINMTEAIKKLKE